MLSVMQEKVYKRRIKDVDDLRSRIMSDELDRRVIDTAASIARTFSCVC